MKPEDLEPFSYDEMAKMPMSMMQRFAQSDIYKE